VEHDPVADALVNGAKAYIDAILAPMLQRLAEAEARIVVLTERGSGVRSAIRAQSGNLVLVMVDGQLFDVGPINGRDGTDIDMSALNETIDARIAAAMPNEVDPAIVVEALRADTSDRIQGWIWDAVGELPQAEPGPPGDSPDPEMIRGMIVTELATMPKPEDGKPGRNADPAEVAEILRSQIEAPLIQRVAEAIAGIPEVEQPKKIDPAEIEAMVDAKVKCAVAALPLAEPGKPGEPPSEEVVRSIVIEEVAKMPAPVDGVSPTPAAVAAILKTEIEPVLRTLTAELVAAIPTAEPHRNVDPAETERLVVAEVTRQMAARPVPRDGHDAKPEDIERAVVAEFERVVPGLVARDVLAATEVAAAEIFETITATVSRSIKDGIAAIPTPRDGDSVTVDDVRPMLEELVSRAVEAFPKPRDGVGLAGGVINRDGDLVVTLSHGEMLDLGRVVGRDVDMAEVARLIAEEVTKIRVPRDGTDGFGFDDMTFEHDGERGFTLRFTRGDLVKEFAFSIPVPIDRGVYKDGTAYARGDGVTFGGHYWIAQVDTAEKPEVSRDWRQAMRRARDGKNTESVKYLPQVKIEKAPETT